MTKLSLWFLLLFIRPFRHLAAANFKHHENRMKIHHYLSHKSSLKTRRVNKQCKIKKIIVCEVFLLLCHNGQGVLSTFVHPK